MTPVNGIKHLPVCIAFSLILAFGPVEAGAHEELEFAEKLMKKGYYALAEDHLIRTRVKDGLPLEVRIRAAGRLADIYTERADQEEDERDFLKQRKYVKKAFEQYSKLLGEAEEHLEPMDRGEILLKQGQLVFNQAKKAAGGMRAAVDEDLMREYRKSALEWFEKAKNPLQESSELLVKKQTRLRGELETHENRKIYQRIQRKAGEATMAFGRAWSEHARLLEGDEQREGFNKAISAFENVADAYPLYRIRYEAYHQIGVCYRWLEKFEKATEYINEALSVRETPAIRTLLRRARLDLAKTYNDRGGTEPDKYGRALSVAEMLMWELKKTDKVAADREAVDTALEVWIEKARAQIGASKRLAGEAETAEAEGEHARAESLFGEAIDSYLRAVDRVGEIAEHPDSPRAADAKRFLELWVQQSHEILGKTVAPGPNIYTYYRKGRKDFEAGHYREGLKAFQKAAEAGDEYLYGATLVPEALFHMALAYYYLSSPEVTGGKYHYYYEAALCFDRIGRRYRKAEFAADASFYAQQFYGALFQQTKELVDRGQRAELDLKSDGERYYRALDYFRRTFPMDARTRRIPFQTAEVAREIGHFEKAGEFYGEVPPGSDRYFEARFREGESIFQAALKLYEARKEEPPVERIGALLERADTTIGKFLSWYAEKRNRTHPRRVEDARKWIEKSQLLRARLLTHDAWSLALDAVDGAQRALSILDDFEKEHLADRKLDRTLEKYQNEVYFLIVRAYCQAGKLGEAERFVDELAGRYALHEPVSSAVRQLGEAYLERYAKLEERGAEGEEIDAAAKSSGRYLRLALELLPEPDIEVYIDTAALVADRGEYAEAIKIIEAGLERLPVDDNTPTEVQHRALETLETYREKGD